MPTDELPTGPVAVVLAGGGARGAYELGALSELLPALRAHGHDVEVLVGTSVGALNVAWLGASAHLPTAAVVAAGERLWTGFGFADVLDPPLSPASARAGLRYARHALRGRGRGPRSLLDPAPLERSLRERVDLDALNANVRAPEVPLAAVAVAASSGLTGRTVVFHAGGGEPARDLARGIDYVACEALTHDHVLASAAIPGIFPSRLIGEPAVARGHYVDGGTRLNTPIKPALELGARRVVIVGLHATCAAADATLAGPDALDAIDGTANLLQALFADPLAQDVQSLARRNERGAATDERVPYIFVAPSDPFAIGRVARDVFDRDYSGLRRALDRRGPGGLGRLLLARDSAVHGEVLSLVFFAPEFARALIALGAADARAWLRAEHDDGVWQLDRLPGT